MKVLMLIPALGNVYGGPSKCIIELAEAIGSKGLEVDIVTTNANGNVNLDVPLNIWIQEQHYRIQYFHYLNFIDYKFTWSLTQWLFQHVQDYDLVHTNAIFSYPILPAAWACQFHQVPYIMTPHGMLEPWALAYKAWKKNFYFSLIEKPALQNASGVQMLASTEFQRVQELGINAPLLLIPNGIHTHDFEKLPSAEIFYSQFPETRNKTLILFLGRIDPKKGLDLLAPAFAQARNLFPNSHLIVAGQDNIGYLPQVKEYFSNTSCLEAVTFTGMLTGETKYSALAAANIFVVPSYSEGFSMSVLEGMASALPCVITTGCNFPEAEAAGAASIVDINASKIADALIAYLQNLKQAQETGIRARQLVFQNYTWEKIADKTIINYQRIVRKKSQKAYSLLR
ncbi:glycosyltransferase [Brunnivagina elsteri]|uniref:Glycosyltransferase n=1 Tax=Brunnivagina elsteri CCALA 953 TaxID=987040 RepID=A0A2A2THL2_9CYAN|nr:glycosyltransferase [Calothrix elsteri]PAX53166.1 glycosyltransferase [Calothrix elsteri CCALA 953]